jgi:hypothetical protein
MASITIKVPEWLDRICVWPAMIYRRHKYGYDFRRIDLGEGVWTILDQTDYYRFGNIKWCLGRHKTKLYATGGIRNKKGGARTVYLHREIMKPPKRRVVDHRNGDSLDNRRANLRLATHAQNMQNRRKTKSKTSSRFIGVLFEKRYRCWVVKIWHKGKLIWLGSFKSEVEAAKAYDRAAIKLRGDFARTNFPRETYVNEEWYKKKSKIKR